MHDLGDEGFPLAGGRLDYIDQRPVAALVYHRNQHVINVFVWPIRDTKTSAPAPASRNGFNTVAWDQTGMRYRVVSDVAANELAGFAERLRQLNAGS